MAERRPRSLDLYQTSRNYGKYLERRVEALEQRNAELVEALESVIEEHAVSVHYKAHELIDALENGKWKPAPVEEQPPEIANAMQVVAKHRGERDE